MQENIQKVLNHLDVWHDILKVCQYFLKNPRPNMYIRELPIQVHTKFVEDYESIFKIILNFLLNESDLNTTETNFKKRFGLLEYEPQFRIRFLDPELQSFMQCPFSDLSINIKDLNTFAIPEATVFITENKMNFITLPQMRNTIAIWGQGQFVSQVKEISWLCNAPLFYWGDIDVHGFEILDTLKSHLPQAISCLMDIKTFDDHKHFITAGKPPNKHNLSLS